MVEHRLPDVEIVENTGAGVFVLDALSAFASTGYQLEEMTTSECSSALKLPLMCH